jgi:hypothetical protein
MTMFPMTTLRAAVVPFIRRIHAVPLLLGAFAAILSVLTAPAIAEATQTEPLDATVQYLIGHVSGSGLTFIRNNSRYSAAEAAEHMHRKYEHFKDEIRTPEDFIARCATRSLLTGKPYLIITAQGEEIPTSDWLGRALQEYRARRPQDP